jgi:protein-tyrosine phosphatase
VPCDHPDLAILFVCRGNTCRSPLAEGIVRAKLERNGLLGRVHVDSAGTSGRTDGLSPDPRARRVARAHGIVLGDQRARTFRAADFREFDRIIVFDRENLAEVRRLAGDDDDRGKVSLLLGDEELADPVGGGRDAFEDAFRRIDQASDGVLDDLLERLP